MNFYTWINSINELIECGKYEGWYIQDDDNAEWYLEKIEYKNQGEEDNIYFYCKELKDVQI